MRAVNGLIFLVACVLLASCGGSKASESRSANPSATATNAAATVVHVTDGDTIKVSVAGVEKTVRLIGIDTPETHKPGVAVECGGEQASANMTRLAPVGVRVRLAGDSTQDRVDRYGRTLAYVSIGRRSLQLEQLRAGWAKVYVFAGKPFQRVDSFRAAAAAAKSANRGVWASCGGDFHSNQPGS